MSRICEVLKELGILLSLMAVIISEAVHPCEQKDINE